MENALHSVSMQPCSPLFFPYLFFPSTSIPWVNCYIMLWALKGTKDVILATEKETEEEEIWEEVEVKEGQE